MAPSSLWIYSSLETIDCFRAAKSASNALLFRDKLGDEDRGSGAENEADVKDGGVNERKAKLLGCQILLSMST